MAFNKPDKVTCPSCGKEDPELWEGEDVGVVTCEDCTEALVEANPPDMYDLYPAENGAYVV